MQWRLAMHSDCELRIDVGEQGMNTKKKLVLWVGCVAIVLSMICAPASAQVLTSGEQVVTEDSSATLSWWASITQMWNDLMVTVGFANSPPEPQGPASPSNPSDAESFTTLSNPIEEAVETERLPTIDADG